jgi:LmbE family N-acetylglucosaminyl deacetylase
VLAVYAHPDDADVACGGSLALWASAGTEVRLLLVTDGGKGTIDPDLAPASLAVLRRDEVAAASKELLVSGVEHLDLPDGSAGEESSLCETFVRRIRAFKPDLVLSHDPTAVFFGSVYVNHRDHRAVGWALLDAVAPASGMPHYFPDAGPAHRVPDLLLSGTLEPDAFVDVSSSIEAKLAAISAHRSQLSDDVEWASRSIREQAARDGRAVGVAFAEGFRHLQLDG